MAKETMYIVTNSTISGNYTPSLFAKEEDAKNWFYELAVDDLMDAWEEDLLEILCSTISKVAKNVIEKMKEFLEEFDNDEDVKAGEELSVDKDEAFVVKGKAIIDEFNSLMKEKEIPFEIDSDDDYAYDLADVIETFIDDLEDEDFYLSDIAEFRRKEFIEFFDGKIGGLEVRDTSIRLDYSDDNFNHIELFNVNVN